MDPNELIKAAPELAKGAGALAAAIPFTAIVKRMLGPAADELAEMWRDQVRMYRYERQLKCVEKAEKMAEDAGLIPQAVPPKILFPLLEGASVEEDENLHDMWAALLANAASPEDAENVKPGFIAVLKQMAVDEAALLNWVYDYVYPRRESITIPFKTIFDAYCQLGFDQDKLEACLNGLEASRLIMGHERMADDHWITEQYSTTERCREFIQACRPPKPK
jgi:Abortive infection alpha